MISNALILGMNFSPFKCRKSVKWVRNIYSNLKKGISEKICICCHLQSYLIDFVFHLVYTSLVPQNIYSASWSTNSQIYSRNCDKQYFYYESIQLKVIKSGYYSFHSYSTIDPYGFIYKDTFNPLNPTENLLHAEDDSSSSLQFKLNTRLSGNMTYVLVISTYELKETGTFSIVVQGPNKIILEGLSEYIHVCII